MMMNMWNLAWIIPVSMFAGAFLAMIAFVLFAANRDRR